MGDQQCTCGRDRCWSAGSLHSWCRWRCIICQPTSTQLSTGPCNLVRMCEAMCQTEFELVRARYVSTAQHVSWRSCLASLLTSFSSYGMTRGPHQVTMRAQGSRQVSSSQEADWGTFHELAGPAPALQV